MKLKVDEKGIAMVKDNMPVYVHEDGSESPFDAKGAMDKIHELNEESKKRRLKIDELEKGLKNFEGLDVDAAKKALETVKNFNDKQLIDANEVEKLKKSIGEVHELNMEKVKKSFSDEREKLALDIDKLNKKIRQLTISNLFSNSPYVKEKLLIPGDMAENFFGHHFKLEETKGVTYVVPYDSIGEKILSQKNPGEIADFEEALPRIIDKYPNKDKITKGGKSGSGAGGNMSSGEKTNLTPDQVRQLSLDEFAAADKAGKIKM